MNQPASKLQALELELRQSRESLCAAKEELEVELLHIVLEKHKGNISKAAEELGLTRPTLYTLMKKHNMKQ